MVLQLQIIRIDFEEEIIRDISVLCVNIILFQYEAVVEA